MGKGWFFIRETSKETYEFGKLKKFLNLVKFMMQDTVLNLCKDSVKEFVEYMLSFIPESTEIKSTAVVHNTFPKKEIADKDPAAADSEEEEEASILLPQEDDLPGVAESKRWLAAMFSADNEP